MYLFWAFWEGLWYRLMYDAAYDWTSAPLWSYKRFISVIFKSKFKDDLLSFQSVCYFVFYKWKLDKIYHLKDIIWGYIKLNISSQNDDVLGKSSK